MLSQPSQSDSLNPNLSAESAAIHLLIQLFVSEKKNIKAFLIFSFTSGLLLVGIPFVVQNLIQQLTLLYFRQSTVVLLFCVLIFLVAIAFMRGLQLQLNERFQRRLFYHTVQKFFSARQENPIKSSQANHFFETLTLQKTSTALAFDGTTLGLQALLGFLLISFYHPLFLGYALIVLSALYYVLRVLGRNVFALNLLESKAKYKIIDLLHQQSRSPDESEYHQLVSQYLSYREKRFSTQFKQSVGLLVIQIVASMLLLGFGSLLVLQHKMTLGQLVASELIVSNVLLSIFKLSHLLDYWYDSLVSVFKINETLEDIHATSK